MWPQAQGETAQDEAAALLAVAEVTLQAATTALDDVIAVLDSEAAELRAQRAATAADIEPDWISRYDRLRQQFDGVAVARLQHSHCSGCHMDLSPLELDQVRAAPVDELAECPQCGRLMAR